MGYQRERRGWGYQRGGVSEAEIHGVRYRAELHSMGISSSRFRGAIKHRVGEAKWSRSGVGSTTALAASKNEDGYHNQSDETANCTNGGDGARRKRR